MCTSSVVYAQNTDVHHVYMGKKSLPRAGLGSKAPPQKRWRENRISEWRRHYDPDFTQQDVADYLAGLTPPIRLDRVSVGRIETGMQMPAIEVIEAMARLYGTDIDSMVNLSPQEAEDVQAFKGLSASERKRALRVYRATQDDNS
jgi:hypothetical protein